jgi:hypothetical protein
MSSNAKALIRRIWSAAPVATVILALALSASAVFGVRAVMFWVHRPPPEERLLPIAAWMTPRYIARSWRVSPRMIAEAIGAPIPPPDGPMSLLAIAELRGVPVDQVVAEAQALVSAIHAERMGEKTNAETGHD